MGDPTTEVDQLVSAITSGYDETGVRPTRATELERVVRDYESAVGNYLRRRLYPLTDGDLDDLVAETFTVVWRRFDAMPVDAELPWIIGVARNVLHNAQRSRRRRIAHEGAVSPRGDAASSEDVVVADARVRHALESLRSDDREVLLLHAWDGLSVADVARIIGVTPDAAAVRLSRARGRFRDFYDQWDES